MKCPKCGGATSVSETRMIYSEVVCRRSRKCTDCNHKYNTYELDEGLWKTIRKNVPAHEHAVEKKRILHQRNQLIKQRLLEGNKHVVVADEFKLSHNMISHIAKQLGVPSPRRLKLERGGRLTG